MNDYAVVLNAGSSSLKFCVYQRPSSEAWTLSTTLTALAPAWRSSGR